jgi:nucleotide-binding universal stress UspA family protein
MRLIHVHEPVAAAVDLPVFPIGYLPTCDEPPPQAGLAEMQAAADRLRVLAATVGADVRVTQDVGAGEVVAALHAFVVGHRHCLVLVGTAPPSVPSALLPKLFSPSLSLIEELEAPIIALPHDAPVGLHTQDLRLLVADDLREGTGELLATAIDFLRTVGHGRIIDTHVKRLAREMFCAALADVYATALGRPAGHPESAPLGIVARIRPLIKRALNDRARQIFARKGHEGVGFQSMVLRGNIVRALRAASQRVNADMLVFGRHRRHHRGDWGGHVSPRVMLTFQKPVLIVPT